MHDTRFDAWTRRRFGLAGGSALAALFGPRAGVEVGAARSGKCQPACGVCERCDRGRCKKKKHGKKHCKHRKCKPLADGAPCPGGTCQTGACTTQPPTPSDLPDIILIYVDDMRQSDYLALTQTDALLAKQGLTFPNYFITTPLCAPSRSSLFRGQYAHNHGVLGNSGDNGGWSAFHDSGDDRNTIATWLRGATPAYRTAHVGKYLNGYKAAKNQVAPGWSDWFVPVPVAFYDYTLNVNGKSEPHGSARRDYLTDVLAEKARSVIATTPASTPLFLSFAPKAPHGPAIPARRHIGAFANQPLDQGGSFNEADISDKPDYVQRPLLTADDIAGLEQTNRDRLESLLAVDEAVAGIVDALQQAGRLERAYFFFVTDNGFLLGQHRRTAKQVPYEEAIRMAMLARGPGVPAGQVNPAMVANIDLAPTIAELAGVPTPGFVDGRSFAPVLGGAASSRQAILIEGFSGTDVDPEEVEAARALPGQQGAPTYHAVRTADRVYVEYRTGERELYNLTADPAELASKHDDPAYAAEAEQLAAWLAALEPCGGPACRTAEDGPPA